MPSVLLRLLLHADAALEDANGGIIEDVAEFLPPLATEAGMHDIERGVGVFAALQQRDAPQRRLGIVAGEAHEELAPG